MRIKTPPQILKSSLLKALMVATLSILSGGEALAADNVTLDFQEKNGAYDIQGAFFVRADRSVVWEVLTDYHHIPKFVGNLKKSQIEEDLGPYHFTLEQEFEGGFLFFTKRVRVLLDVHETWHKTIRFNDTEGKDFQFYQGSWEVSSRPSEGLEINYRLKAKQNFDAPFAGDYMKGGVKDLLDAVRREILRRQDLVEKEKTSALNLATRSEDQPAKAP
jgi:hypothetical protein